MLVSDASKTTTRAETWVGVLVFVAAVVLRLPSLLRPLYLDEFATLEIIAAPTFVDAMQLLRDDTHHPLYFALLYGWAQISDETVWLRVLSLVFDVGALAWLWLGLRRASLRAATLGVALWGAMPVALRFSCELRPYAPLACLAVAAWVLGEWTLHAANNHRGRFFATTCVWSLLAATHPVGILAVVAMLGAWGAGTLAAHRGKRGLSALLRLTLPTLGAGATFAVLHWWFTRDPSGGRISWMPKLSGELVARILNYSFGTDGGAPWALLGVTWTSAHAAGVVIFTGLLLTTLVARQARSWAAASLFDFLIVCLVSLVARPIFWYRSIVPAFIWAAGAGAVGLSRLSRWGAGTAILLVAWQVAVWLPRATRAIDPTAQAATEAIGQLGAQEALYVFPDWMYVTARPFLEPEQWSQIMPCGGDPNQPDKPLPHGVIVVRCGLDLIEGAEGLAACLGRMHAKGVALHDLYVFMDDDDDMYTTAQQQRHTLLTRVQDIYGPCSIEDPNSRVVHLACTTRTP